MCICLCIKSESSSGYDKPGRISESQTGITKTWPLVGKKNHVNVCLTPVDLCTKKI